MAYRVILEVPQGMTFDMLSPEQQDAIRSVFGQFVMPIPRTVPYNGHVLCDAVTEDNFSLQAMQAGGFPFNLLGMWHIDQEAPVVELNTVQYINYTEGRAEELHTFAGWPPMFAGQIVSPIEEAPIAVAPVYIPDAAIVDPVIEQPVVDVVIDAPAEQPVEPAPDVIVEPVVDAQPIIDASVDPVVEVVPDIAVAQPVEQPAVVVADIPADPIAPVADAIPQPDAAIVDTPIDTPVIDPTLATEPVNGEMQPA